MINSRVPVIPLLITIPLDNIAMADGSCLPVGNLMSYAKAHKNGMLQSHFDFDKLMQRQEKDWHYFYDRAKSGIPSVWIVSCYVWNWRKSLEIARVVKTLSPQSLVIAGGPHIPAYEEENRKFFADHPYIDITACGEGEVTFAEILETIADAGSLHADFSHVHGLSFRTLFGIVKTPGRAKARDLTAFPSAYLTGELDDPSFCELDILVLETNRGCPFGCTFCDWGSATGQKFSLFDMERVRQEIEIIASKKPHVIFIADSNFGAFERDIEIAQLIADAKRKYGYPKKCGASFAKNASPRLAKIIRILHKANLQDAGLISMQSTDRDTLLAVNRENIRNEKYENLIDIFKSEGMQLSSELLVGLPGQSLKSQKEDLQFFIDRKLMTIAYNVQVMPNSPMNEPSYRKKYAITTDANGYVMSTSTFTYDELQFMARRFLAFQLFYVVGLLRYYLYFLQVEHGVPAMDFVTALLETMRDGNASYPLNRRIYNELLVLKHEWSPCLVWETHESEFLFNHLDDFFSEIARFTREHFGILLESQEQESLFSAQSAVMRVLGKSVPFVVALPHDVDAWFEQVKSLRVADSRPLDFRRLAHFPPGRLEVKALKKRTINSLSLIKFNRFTGAGWELRSSLRFHSLVIGFAVSWQLFKNVTKLVVPDPFIQLAHVFVANYPV